MWASVLRRVGYPAGFAAGLICFGVTWMTSAAIAATEEKVLAYVDGVPIEREQVERLLWDGFASRGLVQVVHLTMARNEASRIGLRVTQADIDAEYQSAVRDIKAEFRKHGEAVTEAGTQEALDKVLDSRGITRAEFMLGLERNAYLRAIIERNLTIDETTLREEFARQVGEKVEVRHIQVGRRDWRLIREVRSRLVAGEDFAQVARALSQNRETAPLGGKYPAFTFDEAVVPAAIRQVAFDLKVGGFTEEPIAVDDVVHFIKVDQRIPREDVKFEDMRAEIEQRVRDRVATERMSQLMQDLILRRSQVQVLDRELRREWYRTVEPSDSRSVPSSPGSSGPRR